MKKLVITACLALISACGPLNDNNDAGLVNVARTTFGLGGDAPAAPPGIDPNIANAQPGDLLLVKILSRDAVAALTKVVDNGDSITWISPGQVTMTFDRGILVGTRGLNDDLMGVDAPGTWAAITAGGGTVTRRHSFLDSEDQIITRDMTCTVTRIGPEDVITVEGIIQGIRFDEACTGPALVFTNKYWLLNGAIIRSSQAVSAGVGFIQVDQL